VRPLGYRVEAVTGDHRSSAADLQKQLAQRTRELGDAQKLLAEALEQQTATSRKRQHLDVKHRQSGHFSGNYKKITVFASFSAYCWFDPPGDAALCGDAISSRPDFRFYHLRSVCGRPRPVFEHRLRLDLE
jgi:hypothetical protein